MLPTRAGSTFSIFSTFHIDASVLKSCFVANTGLSVRVLIATRAFQNSHSRSLLVHNYRPGPELQTLMATSDVLSMHQQQPKTLQSRSKRPKSSQEQTRFSQEQPRSSQNHLRSKQNQPRSSQELLKSANIKPIQTVIINWPILMSIPFLPVTSTRMPIVTGRASGNTRQPVRSHVSRRLWTTSGAHSDDIQDLLGRHPGVRNKASGGLP